MRKALELARLGEGAVEPNPMVGCVLVHDGMLVGEGFHGRFGGPHAEVEALRNAGDRAREATCYVTLEPCSHEGKTPPCTNALIEAGIRRVVLAMRDPNPSVDGRGLKLLRQAGIDVTENVLEKEARSLTAPYLTRLTQNRPWVVAKWAMTLDGRLASSTGSSRWISGTASRAIVQRLRSRMDAILIGLGTAQADDPLLTVRLDEATEQTGASGIPGDRRGTKRPLRIVLDARAELAPESRLVQTARDLPVLLVVGPEASSSRLERLRDLGCEPFSVARNADDFDLLFAHLADRGVTNLLVEGGSRVFGELFDRRLVDEVHAFVAPKIVGGEGAVPVVAGTGLADMTRAFRLETPDIRIVDSDVYIRGRVRCPDGEKTKKT